MKVRVLVASAVALALAACSGGGEPVDVGGGRGGAQERDARGGTLVASGDDVPLDGVEFRFVSEPTVALTGPSGCASCAGPRSGWSSRTR